MFMDVGYLVLDPALAVSPAATFIDGGLGARPGSCGSYYGGVQTPLFAAAS